jgi:serine/threonine-protein kinase HipA
MSDRELVVLINDERIGLLRDSNDLWSFEYVDGWSRAPESFDLSPSLSRARQLHADGASDRPVQWYFDNLLPEESMRTVLAKEAQLSAEDAFGLLGYFGAESAGSLVLLDPAHPPAMERGLKALPFTELSRRIRDLPRASLTKEAPKKMSLAGAQHKLLVVLDAGQLFEPLPGTPSTHILKPSHLDPAYPASVINEFFCMRLAHALGLSVPAVTRLYVPEPVYIVERFDRSAIAGSTDAKRLHVIDTCQLLNKARAFKYTGAQVSTLAQAAIACRERASARLQLFAWLVFNFLIGNGDNHLKNISFSVDAGGIRIAPAYDLLSTSAYDTPAFATDRAHWPRSPLAIPIGSATTFSEVRRSHLIEAAKALGIAPATAQRVMDTMLKDILSQADEIVLEIDRERERQTVAEPAKDADHAADASRVTQATETRVLDVVRHIILAETMKQLRTP